MEREVLGSIGKGRGVERAEWRVKHGALFSGRSETVYGIGSGGGRTNSAWGVYVVGPGT
jgi:hypothetical protein